MDGLDRLLGSGFWLWIQARDSSSADKSPHPPFDKGGMGGFEEVWTGDYVFENEWQSFRTKKDRSLELKSVFREYPPGRRKVAVKVVVSVHGSPLSVVRSVVIHHIYLRIWDFLAIWLWTYPLCDHRQHLVLATTLCPSVNGQRRTVNGYRWWIFLVTTPWRQWKWRWEINSHDKKDKC